MANTAPNVSVPYDDLTLLQKDHALKQAVIDIINTEYPDDTCMMTSIKTVLGIKDPEKEQMSIMTKMKKIVAVSGASNVDYIDENFITLKSSWHDGVNLTIQESAFNKYVYLLFLAQKGGTIFININEKNRIDGISKLPINIGVDRGNIYGENLALSTIINSSAKEIQIGDVQTSATMEFELYALDKGYFYVPET